MTIIDVYWTPQVNRLVIRCECGAVFDHPAWYSIHICPRCAKKQIWHGGDPKGTGTKWDFSDPMKIELRR